MTGQTPELCRFKQRLKGGEILDKEQLKAEIERIQRLIDNKHSKFIHDELKQYLKILKRELREKE